MSRSRVVLPRLVALLLAGVAAACERPERPDPPPVAGRAAADSLLAAGEALYLQSEFDSATVRWTRALAWSRRHGDAQVEARALTWLGLAAYRTGAHAEARRLGEAALAVKRRAGLEAELSRSYNALGLLAWNEGRLLEAQALFDTAGATARAVRDDEGEAKAAGNLGLVLTELGDFGGARGGFEAMLVAGRRLGEQRLQGNALTNLGMLDARLGDPPAAVSRLAEARRHYRAIGYGVGEQNALGQLATAQAALGDYAAAFASLDSALAICRALGLRQDEAATLEVLADLHRRTGNLRHALRLYQEAAPIDAELELEVERGSNARARAELQSELGRPDLARALALEALRAHRATAARYEELQDLLVLAELERRGGRPADALRGLTAADSLARAMGARTAKAQVALARARAADGSGDAAAVLAALPPALDRDLEALGYDALAEGQGLRARAHARRGDLEAAIASGTAAVAAVERVRAGIGSGQLRVRHAGIHGAIYADLVGVLVAAGRVDAAFAVADAAHGRALLEQLAFEATDRTAAAGGGLARRQQLLSEAGELTGLAAELDRLPPEERDSSTAIRSARIAQRLARLRADYEALLAQGGERAGRLPVIGTAPAAAREVRAVLDGDEVLLEYLAAAGELHLFVVTRERLEHLSLPLGADELQRRVDLAHRMLSTDGGDASAVLAGLHRDLVGPAQAAGLVPAGRRLVVVPHGPLERLPFGALRDAARGRWLMQDHSVLRLASSGSLVALRRLPATGAAAGGRQARIAVFAPHPDRLPGTRAEAGAVASAWPGARVFVGAAAREGRVLAALAAYGVVHVATHGRLDPRSPMFSHLELRPDRSGADGRLEVHELFAVPVRAGLVFLSGCETAADIATGPGAGGEYATLAHVILYRGGRNVIGTRWAVEDRAAARLAAAFYGHLRRLAAPEALAAAQRDLLADSVLADPRAWAAYEVSGDGRPIGHPHRGPRPSVYQ